MVGWVGQVKDGSVPVEGHSGQVVGSGVMQSTGVVGSAQFTSIYYSLKLTCP